MIDKRRARFLDFTCFGVLGTGRLFGARGLLSFLPLLSAVWVGGCTGRPTPAPVEDSLTAGRITVVSAPEARPLLDREREAFEELYPQASIHVTTGSSRDAVRALFGAVSDLAVLSRDLSPEERGAATRGGLELEGYRFAKDAVVVVVHSGNPVENLALDDLRGIYDGKIDDWSELGGPAGPIEPVFPPPESDMADFFVQQVMDGQPIRAPVLPVASDSEAVASVARRPGAVAFVSLAWAQRGAKSLRLSTLMGLPYWNPDLEAVYRGDYPLTRFLSFYVRAPGPRLAHGFITFVTSRDGQKIVHDSGLVPTSVPVRFVRRSPLRGAH